MRRTGRPHLHKVEVELWLYKFRSVTDLSSCCVFRMHNTGRCPAFTRKWLRSLHLTSIIVSQPWHLRTTLRVSVSYYNNRLNVKKMWKTMLLFSCYSLHSCKPFCCQGSYTVCSREKILVNVSNIKQVANYMTNVNIQPSEQRYVWIKYMRKNASGCWERKLFFAIADWLRNHTVCKGWKEKQKSTSKSTYIFENQVIPIVRLVAIGSKHLKHMKHQASTLIHAALYKSNWSILCCVWHLSCVLNLKIHYAAKLIYIANHPLWKPTHVVVHGCTCNMHRSANRHTCVHTDAHTHTPCVATNQDIHLRLGQFDSWVMK